MPFGASPIDDFFSVYRDDRFVTWFHGCHPIRAHPVSDHATQRAMMAFLHVHGGMGQARIAAALGVHENTVGAAVKLYREKGDAGFYQPTAVRGAVVMTPAVMAECRRLLGEGRRRSEVAAAVGVKKHNIDKAIQKGLLPPSARSVARLGSSRSERAAVDAGTELGVACVRVQERALAACGFVNRAETRFENCRDVEHGGVLCALPALGANGLLEHLGRLRVLPSGYYGLVHIFVLLALMALLRVKTVEALRRGAPGEFGKLFGLDRIPEVRCLRGKLGFLAKAPEAVATWANLLSRDWMQADPDLAGTLYVDGHVRVYHGSKTALPPRYVARQRLCLRGVTDYWVNDREGKPFFYVDRPVDNGLLAVLRTPIVPRLLREVPNQPTAAELAANPWLPRFRLIFDRAGCSPVFFRDMWQQHRLACLTYRKNPGEDWPEAEFRAVEVRLANGGTGEMELAERGVWFGNDQDGLWCREFRRLRRGKHGVHQTAIVATDYQISVEDGAPAMFARWGQENFFRYMLEEFGLDLLAEHQTEAFPCDIPVLNPAWRKLDSECRSLRGKITVAKTRLADYALEPQDMQPGRMEAWLEEKETRTAAVAAVAAKLDVARGLRRVERKHVPLNELPPECQFERLAPTMKLMLDTVRMIAYRAESALAALVRPAMASPEEARSLMKALFNTAADLYPDAQHKILRVVLHPLAEPRLNRTVETLLGHLNEVEFIYPETDLQLVYELLPPAAHDG